MSERKSGEELTLFDSIVFGNMKLWMIWKAIDEGRGTLLGLGEATSWTETMTFSTYVSGISSVSST